MSESFDKAVEAAHASMAGTFEERGCTLSRSAVYMMLTAALPHLTAEDVPHVAREAWARGRAMGLSDHVGSIMAGRPLRSPNPYAEEADHE
ncbi:hypothetical protein AB0E44_09285 [Micrococcus terreus]|uniref:hypothetical protein n=1 Tax=Micrococcus terreus TaxID=574650 RepID=UPI0033D55212